jgi:hypothetical protein
MPSERVRASGHKPGNMAVPVNAPRLGLRNFDDVLEAVSLPELNRQSSRF